jgi:hypothetical protein
MYTIGPQTQEYLRKYLKNVFTESYQSSMMENNVGKQGLTPCRVRLFRETVFLVTNVTL